MWLVRTLIADTQNKLQMNAFTPVQIYLIQDLLWFVLTCTGLLMPCGGHVMLWTLVKTDSGNCLLVYGTKFSPEPMWTITSGFLCHSPKRKGSRNVKYSWKQSLQRIIKLLIPPLMKVINNCFIFSSFQQFIFREIIIQTFNYIYPVFDNIYYTSIVRKNKCTWRTNGINKTGTSDIIDSCASSDIGEVLS